MTADTIALLAALLFLALLALLAAGAFALARHTAKTIATAYRDTRRSAAPAWGRLRRCAATWA